MKVNKKLRFLYELGVCKDSYGTKYVVLVMIDEEGRKYSYDYATGVGIKEKDVHDTKAVLIFIPDDVLIFPDKDQREQPQ